MALELENNFCQKMDIIFPNNYPKKILLAISGGLDSVALLFLLQKYCNDKKITLIAATIDHKMRDASAKEAAFVADICQNNQIKHHLLINNNFIPDRNIEANLREIRYNLLLDLCHEEQIEYLFLAHHKQDVAENFLIRLFRGSGIDGLSAMEEISKLKNIHLIRPLLDFSKEELQKYLKEKNIKHIEDPTNKDEKFLRNKIRNFLNNIDDKDLINDRIIKASKSILENRKIINKIVKEKADQIYQLYDLGYFLLNKQKFKDLELELALRYINIIVNYFNGKFYKSRLRKIENLYHWMTSNKKHLAKNFDGAMIEDYDDNYFIIYREKSKIQDMIINKDGQYDWDNRFKITIKNKKQSYQELTIGTLHSTEFNQLLKNNINFKRFNKIKNPIKKIFYTIPVIRSGNDILAIPNLDFINGDIDILCILK